MGKQETGNIIAIYHKSNHLIIGGRVKSLPYLQLRGGKYPGRASGSILSNGVEITSTFPSLGDASTPVPMTSIITCSLPASIFWWAKNTQLGMTVLEEVILTIILIIVCIKTSYGLL